MSKKTGELLSAGKSDECTTRLYMFRIYSYSRLPHRPKLKYSNTLKKKCGNSKLLNYWKINCANSKVKILSAFWNPDVFVGLNSWKTFNFRDVVGISAAGM